MGNSLLGVRVKTTDQTKRVDKQVTLELLHKSECKACPYNKHEKLLIHPKMEPTCFPPTSWQNAQDDEVPKPVKNETIANIAATVHADGWARQTR